jgi:hypothetical protein
MIHLLGMRGISAATTDVDADVPRLATGVAGWRQFVTMLHVTGRLNLFQKVFLRRSLEAAGASTNGSGNRDPGKK